MSLRRAPRPSVPVTLYSRAGCHLCEVMKAELLAARLPHAFELREVDIGSDPQLEREHGLSIPVLQIGGRTAFKGRMTREELVRKFQRLGEAWLRDQEARQEGGS